MQGSPADVYARLSSPEARRTLYELILSDATLHDGTLEAVVRVPDGTQKTDSLKLAEAVEEVIQRFRTFAESLDTPLRGAAHTTSRYPPGLRAYNLAMLWLHHPETEQLTTALESVVHPLPETDLLTAREETRCIEDLRAPEGARDPDVQVGAVIRLGRAGTAAALPTLREWRRRNRRDPTLEETAQRAIEQVEARVPTHGAGGLAVADHTRGSDAGALAVVDNAAQPDTSRLPIAETQVEGGPTPPPLRDATR